MNFAILIQARLGSSRFPKKIIQYIDGKTVIEYMVDRLLKVFKKKNIIINTTNSKKDDELIQIIEKKKLKYFRGSENNVLDRYLKCSKKFKVKNIIHLTSDCPLVDTNLISKMKKTFENKKLDYFANTYPPNMSNFPDGSDIEIYKQKSLIKLSKLSNK
ncbi:glutamate-1-semialdehyde aminotransferase, partial [Candidatus Pelagibacter sp.]|nr:glutamate-1-semialdehyde aminotransferase [Candidatus Pelagibacter sp.]